jgi:hypothetical protein
MRSTWRASAAGSRSPAVPTTFLGTPATLSDAVSVEAGWMDREARSELLQMMLLVAIVVAVVILVFFGLGYLFGRLFL